MPTLDEKDLAMHAMRIPSTGITQSQARVSTLMRNLEASAHLENPGLIEIKSGQAGGLRVNEFIVNISITRARVEDSAAKPAPKPAAKG